MSDHYIDEGDLRKYRTEVPNMADDELDPYQYRLYAHYKRVCGANGGKCWESRDTTAEKCKMSGGMVTKTRQWLADNGWIRLERGDNQNDTYSVFIVDRWTENMNRYANRSSCGDDRRHTVTAGRHVVTQRSNSVKKQPKEERTDKRIAANDTPPAPVQPDFESFSAPPSDTTQSDKIKQFPVRASRTTPTPDSAAPPSPPESAIKDSQHPFNATYRDVFKRFPNKAQMGLLAKLPTDEQSVARWRLACEKWAFKPYHPGNLDGILDWYHGGVPVFSKPAVNGNHRRGRDAPPPLPYRKPTQQEIDEALNAEILE